LENLKVLVDINIGFETIRENIKIVTKEEIGYYKFQKHGPWFSEGCSKLLGQKKTNQTAVVTAFQRNK
jgi:hypothetical protein